MAPLFSRKKSMNIKHFHSAQQSPNSPNSVSSYEGVESTALSASKVVAELPPALQLSDEALHDSFLSLENFYKTHEENPLSCSIEVENIKQRFLRSNIITYKLSFFHKTGEELCISKRRLEEFILLRKALKLRLPGCLIPPLLTNTLQNGNETKKDSKNKNIIGLERFTNSILRHPFLRNERLFQDFMRGTELFNSNRGSSLKEEPSVGFDHWSQMIKLTPTPKSTMLLIKSIDQEINILHLFYKSLIKDLKEHKSQLEMEKNGVKNIISTFSKWMKIEGGHIPNLIAAATVIRTASERVVAPSVGDSPDTSGAVLPKEPTDSLNQSNLVAYDNISLSNLIKQMEETYTKSTVEFDTRINGVKKFIKNDLTFEMKVLCNFKEALQACRDAISVFEKADKLYRTAEKQYISKVEKVKKQLDAPVTVSIQRNNVEQNLPQPSSDRVDGHGRSTDRELRGNDAEQQEIARGLESGSSPPFNDEINRQNNRVSRAVESGQLDRVNTDLENEVNSNLVVQKYKVTLDRSKQHRYECLIKYHAVLRGMLVIELNRFKHERAARNAKILKDLSLLNLTYASSLYSNWKETESSMPNQVTARSDVNLLDSLKEKFDVTFRGGFNHFMVTDQRITQVESGHASEIDDNNYRRHASSILSESDASVTETEHRISNQSNSKKRQSYRAIYDFSPEQTGERNLKTGEVVVGEYSSEDPAWFWVYDQGYVPASHLEPCLEETYGSDSERNTTHAGENGNATVVSTTADRGGLKGKNFKDENYGNTNDPQSMNGTKIVEMDNKQDTQYGSTNTQQVKMVAKEYTRPSGFLTSIKKFDKTSLKKQL